jgi:putative transcriptional regulator
MSPLAPGLLIAAPPLADPSFDRSVVLLAAHGEEGAFGWIVNGREVMTLDELLDHVDLPPSPTHVGLSRSSGGVRLGGPVAREQVWLLYRTTEKDKLHDVPDQFDVGCGVTASPSQRVLQAVAEGRAPDSLMGVLGYAGWAPNQLEEEIRRGAWLPISGNVSLLFDVAREEIWQRAYEQVGASPMAFTTRTVGSA